MITCPECAGIIDTAVQTEADALFKKSVEKPDEQHGVTAACSLCGRQWLLAVSPLGFEGDYIPEGAVLTEDMLSNDNELTELEALETLYADGVYDRMREENDG